MIKPKIINYCNFIISKCFYEQQQQNWLGGDMSHLSYPQIMITPAIEYACQSQTLTEQRPQWNCVQQKSNLCTVCVSFNTIKYKFRTFSQWHVLLKKGFQWWTCCCSVFLSWRGVWRIDVTVDRAQAGGGPPWRRRRSWEAWPLVPMSPAPPQSSPAATLQQTPPADSRLCLR